MRRNFNSISLLIIELVVVKPFIKAITKELPYTLSEFSLHFIPKRNIKLIAFYQVRIIECWGISANADVI